MKTSSLPLWCSFAETSVALVAGFFTLLAVAWPDWLESFGVHLDSGNSALEWAVPAVMALTAVISGVRAGRRWRLDCARAVRVRA